MKQFSWLTGLIAVAVLSACDKFEGDQTIPAYLQIDSIGFSCDYASQGTDDQRLVDAWVYVDDDLIGGFELPATIPVLADGLHKLEIRPGIKLNGISSTRAPYPCMRPVILEEFGFIPDSVLRVECVSSYMNNAEFVWMEDFEDASLAIHPTDASDTNIIRTQPAGSSLAFTDGNSQYSGISYLDKTRHYVELVSDDGNGQGFIFDRGDFIFLEMHYKFDVPVMIGMYIRLNDGTVQDRAFLGVNDAKEWKKIYVNFTPIVNETVDAENFKIYFQAELGPGHNNDLILLDNLKIVTRPNL